MHSTETDRPRVGIVGGGQLALMLLEASLRIDVPVTVLGAQPTDPAVRACSDPLVGDPRSLGDLRSLAARCDVLTFDHELVSPTTLRRLEHEGVVLRPSAAAMATAVDKVAQQRLFARLGLPTPPTIVAFDAEAAAGAAAVFARPVVVKTASGGYDGRGVALLPDARRVARWAQGRDGLLLVQPELDLDAEVAVQVVRGVDGEMVVYPVVRTVQVEGMCRIVQVPSGLPGSLEDEAAAHARRLAEELGVVGLLAVEFFVVGGRLLINEIATRPHNSGHVTQTSSLTCQFENHLRAVCGLRLGATDLVVNAAAMANVVGRSPDRDLDLRAVDPDVSVHLYGKAPGSGRKLGHVNAVGDTPEEAVVRALRGATALTGEGVPA